MFAIYHYKKKTLVFAFFSLLIVVPNGTSFGRQDDNGSTTDLFEMSLEQLMDIPIVVASSSRIPQEIRESSSPVSVLTCRDIHYSGLTSIPEILQFAPGVDVVKIDRRRYAIGIHGLNETLCDRTTLLIDGRPADNPIYGGPDFQGLPLPIDDIERIEIVRSPGSASWGANALTGLINIVPKRPEAITGGFARSTVTEFGDTYTHLRWAEKQDKWSWRLSSSYQDTKSSEDAIDGTASYESSVPALNGFMGFDNFVARDFSRNMRFDSEAFYKASEKTELSVGLGYTHVDAGDWELGGYYPMENIREDHVRSHLKLNHKFEDAGSAYLQWYGKFWSANWPMVTIMKTREHEFEGQYNFAPTQSGHNFSLGAAFSWDHINTDSEADMPQQSEFAGEPFDEYNTAVFAIDRWKLTNRLTLESQLRIDDYSPTQTDWSGRFSAIYALDEKKDHIVRLSAARAFRAPLI